MSRFQKYIAAGSLLCLSIFLSFSAVVCEADSLKNGAVLKTQDQDSLKIFGKARAGSSVDKKTEYVPGEVIVKFKTGKISLSCQAGLSEAKSFAAVQNLSLKENVQKQNIAVFKINDSRSVESAVQELKKNSNVEYAQPNFIYYPSDIDSNDTYKNLLWGIDNTGQTVNGITGTADADIDAPEAWAINEGMNTSTIVAVLDTGVAYNHPDLAANMWDGANCKDENGDPLGGCNHGYDYLAGDKDPLPVESSHGTHVAGTIAAVKNNGQGIIGVAPHAKIMAVKVGEEFLSDAVIIKGIAFAEQNGAKIINASWGGSASSCDDVYDEALYQAIQGFSGLFVTSAGNDSENHNGSSYFGAPADYGETTSCWAGLDNIISVAATNSNDALAYFSDYGSNFIDVAAPGVDIYSTVDYYYSTIFNENFEEVTAPDIPADWIRAGSANNWRSASVSSSNILYADSSFPYADNASSSVTSPAYDLSSTTEAALGFSVSCDTEYDTDYWRDYLSLFLSSDGVNFNRVLRLDEFYIDTLNSEDPFSSTSAASMYLSAALSSGYLTGNFKIRFGWTSNGTDNNYGGCWIDNLNISKLSYSLDGTNGGYDYMSGTSMAVPHVVGLAALIWGDDPALTAAQVKSIILGSGDSLPSLNGKTVTGKRINAHNALGYFNPVIGYESDNVIPTSSIINLNNGSGGRAVNFKVKDGLAGLPIILSDFGYSLDGGAAWIAPDNGDDSAAFSENWKTNDAVSEEVYLSSLDYSGNGYSFYFNTQHEDFSDFNNTDTDNIMLRFKASDGVKTSGYVLSGPLSIDNIPPAAPVITQPATTTYINADSYSIIGTEEPEAIITITKNGLAVSSTSTLATTSDFSITVPLEQNSTNTFGIIVTDSGGNSLPTIYLPAIIEESNSPVLSLLSVGGDLAAPYAITSSVPEIVFNATDTSPTLSCRWDTIDAGYSAMSAENEFLASTTASSSSFTLPDQGSDGVKTVHISCEDQVANENSADDNLDISFILDRIKPAVFSTSASPNPAIAGTVNITVNFTDAGGMDYNVDPVVSVLGLHSVYTSTTKVSFASSTYIGTIVLQSDSEEVSGAVIKVVGAKDLAGNTMIDNENAGNFAVDTIAPTAVLNGYPSASTAATGVDVTVSGTGVSFYKYKLDSGNYSSSTAIASHIVLSLSAGSYTLSVVGGDSAGNWQTGASSTNYTWTIISSNSSSNNSGSYSGSSSGVASDTTAPAISNVVATPTSGTTATITWQTNENSLTWLNYGTSTVYGQQVKTASYASSHSVSLTGLTASTTYHYQVKSQDSSSNSIVATDKTFTTLAAGQTAVVPTTTAATTTSATAITLQKPFSQMTREELISLILQIIISLQSKKQAAAALVSLPVAGQVNAAGLGVIPADFIFKTNLKFGDNSTDVRYLQIVLNSDPDTLIASKGFGSPGYETIYFGRSTLAAVKKFQLKYRSELIDPFNLANPVGEVGGTTRTKLNSLLGR